MHQVPTYPLYPHQMQYPNQMRLQNMVIPSQPWAKTVDQQQWGFNGGEVPHPHGITPWMNYCDQKHPSEQNVPRNCPPPGHPQTFNTFSNQQPYNYNNPYDWQPVGVRPPQLHQSTVPLPLNSMIQLQGYFKLENEDVWVKVTTGKAKRDGMARSVVQSLRNGVEALPDQFIDEEGKQFKLCSTDGSVKAVILKGTLIKDSLTWVSTEGGKKIVWERPMDESSHSAPQSNVSPNISTREPNTPDSFSVSMTTSNRGESLETSTTNSFTPMNQELDTQFSHMNISDSNRTEVNSTRNYRRPSADMPKISQQDYALLELIKAQCNNSTWLKDKVVEWGSSHGSKCTQITQENVLKLSHGRLWVSARCEDADNGSFDEALDDLKGAYQECGFGIYKQPVQKSSDRGVQHRLLKGSVGLWVLEKYNVKEKVWNVRAQQNPDGRWVDLENNRMIEVTLVPLQSVLEKLREGGSTFQEVENWLDFLFNSCNQRKLNGQLRTRNLNNNIANLKAKLEKQHALSFSVIVARTANSIAS